MIDRRRSGARCRHGLLLALLLSAPAWAWNAAGHRLVASIAWSRLEPEARSEAARLLREHPDAGRWSRRAGDADPDRTAFVEASTWPDDIRKDARFYDAGVEPPTPLLGGFPDMERHRGWHYVNWPIDAPAPANPLSGQIDLQLAALSSMLGTVNAPPLERRYALPWLIHLVGDAHQPLHTSVRSGADGKPDKLGSAFKVINPFNPRKGSSTLHAFWDDLPGPPWLRGDALESAARTLTGLHPPSDTPGTSRQWLEESWWIARESGYPADLDTVPTISESFFETSRQIANRRIAEAGYRLADLLNRLLRAN